jgi:serine/threonine protein kinase
MTSTGPLAGRYRLVRLIGQGGMSDVYEAFDEATQAAVAVKLVRPGDRSFAHRLAQEARALERLDHPGVVRLLASGLAGDQAYLVMEMVSGCSLREELAHGPLPPERVAAIGSQLADALSYAHARGVVHRDVKPSNILLAGSTTARLSDFGIARFLDASTLTAAGTTLGTAAYMAPEQLEDHKVGPPADIWSLGIVLLECLSGRRVYDGSPSEVVARRLAGPVPIPVALPVPWTLVLSGMLDHRPDHRLDGAQVAELLRARQFSASWEPPSRPDPEATLPIDLTALAPEPTAGVAPTGPLTEPLSEPLSGPPTARLAPELTEVAGYRPPVPPSPSATRSRRRRMLSAAVVLVLAADAAGAVIGLVFRTSARNVATTTTTGATATSATTAAPSTTGSPAGASTVASSASQAVGQLVQAVAAGEQAGSVSADAAAMISGAAEKAIADYSAGHPEQAAADLQQAASALAAAVDSGSVTADEGATLQADLSALAAALGLPQAASVPAGPSPSGPAHGHHRGD